MKRLLLTLAGLLLALGLTAKDYTLTSPDGHLTVQLRTGSSLTYSIARDGKILIEPSAISLTLSDGTVYGGTDKLSRSSRQSVSQSFETPLFKRSVVVDKYNELRLNAPNYAVVFRAYDDGIAWRFEPKKPVTIVAEEETFTFAEDWPLYVPYVSQHTETLESQLYSSFESQYDHHALSAWNRERLGFLPVTVQAADGIRICLAESDLRDYAGMFVYNGDGGRTLKGVFARFPKSSTSSEVTAREDFIAKDTKDLPWRVVIVATEDRQLAESDMTYRLAKPAEGDFSWVKPGKVAWDWWNSWNIYGVDFESGINNDTYKYYIDFASANGIEYVILDEGWSVREKQDLLTVVPELDLPMLVEYAAERGVGLILWARYKLFDRQMEEVCAHYSEMGIKGWKVDFMARDDQEVVRFYERAARTAAKYRMLMDFHGAYKPTGLHRTWPNVLNYEGVYGLENMKWSQDADQVTYDVTIPFARLVAGPADYTQGAMRNATKDNYHAIHSEPMSQGTRCHQLAEYVIFDAPLTMLCDSPSNYLNEPECTELIASIPTVWDETIALDGRIAEYVVMARRHGDKWYIGALNGWQARDVTIDFNDLPDRLSAGTLFLDGVNAEKAARDYAIEDWDLTDVETLTIHLASGGGCILVAE